MILNGSIYNEKKLRNIVQNNREINKININDIITIKFCNASRKLMIKCLKKKKKTINPAFKYSGFTKEKSHRHSNFSFKIKIIRKYKNANYFFKMRFR